MARALDMEVSLDQAIAIYAGVLKYWHGDGASHEARAKALECKTAGDIEGFHAWARVAKVCEVLRTVDRPAPISEA
jgi:hypothetical protein